MSEVRIYKYLCPSKPSEFEVLLPLDSRILSFGQQDGNLVFWAAVGEEPEVPFVFQLAFTGEEVPERSKHIGTLQDPGTGLVWHLFHVG